MHSETGKGGSLELKISKLEKETNKSILSVRKDDQAPK